MSSAGQPSRETQREVQLGRQAGTWLSGGTAQRLVVAASGCGHWGSVRCPCCLLSVREGVGAELWLMAPFIEHLFCAKPGAESFTSFLSSLHNSSVKTAWP